MPLAPLWAPWPAPVQVKALVTTRIGGVSQGAFSGLNMSLTVGDDAACVAENRERVQEVAQLPSSPFWLQQVHGTDILAVQNTQTPDNLPKADGAITALTGQVLAVMTADCLPVFITDKQGQQVSVLHAGWRGLAQGIIERGVGCFSVPASDLLVWLGPAIGPRAFEVGANVRTVFVQKNKRYASAFIPFGTKWHANLYQLAHITLQDLGVQAIYGGEHCTFHEAQLFYSYRRDTQTGRMASLIWREKS